MRWLTRVPLAWRNLVHDKRRFVVSVAGITFAALLMFMELGFWNALLNAAVELIRQFNGQIIIASSARHTLALREPLSTRHLEQARGVEGVKAVFPVYVELRGALWKTAEKPDPNSPSWRPIRVVAFNPAEPVFDNPEIEAKAPLLRDPDTVLFDRKSKKGYGKHAAGVEGELSRRSVRIVGTFSLGTDFTTDGTLLMSDLTYARLFPNPLHPKATLRMADIGVVQVDDPARVLEVKRALEAALPGDDVKVFTKEEFMKQEKLFWRKATPVGFVFTFGLVMGFIVGAVICYQILSSDVTDHLGEYATLKALGYRNSYLTGVVLQEALWLSLIGFVPALLLGDLLYDVLSRKTGLPLSLTTPSAALVLVLTTFMCILSGVIAVRKVQAADPAEVF